MKYFSVNSVVNAYSNFQGALTNKTWGLLCVVKQLNGAIIPGTTYQFDCNKLSNYIESLFCLSDNRKGYIGDKKWYVKFSTQWQSFITKQSKGLPNIYDIIVWAYRKESFPDNLTNDYLLKRFAEDFHFDLKNCESLFSAQERDIEYNDVLYNESELLSAINTTLNLNLGENITAESDSVKASVGELSRGPFIQTLYAALDATEYFLISQVNFDEIYPFGRTVYKTESPTDLPLQQIYYGTPGSGKSHKVKDMVEAAYPDKDEREKYVFRTTFHPDSDYASFVGCYKPQMKDGAITYEFVPQAFTKAYVQAWNEPEKQIYLIVEEINRGNCAQIFGDLFQLLDRKNGVSEYPIDADDDLRQYLEKELNEAGKAGIANGKIKLPANLNILATMNTSDQSLFPMDSAFKRRWNWDCVPIDYNNPKSSEFRITIGDQNYKWLDFLKNVNTHIFNTTGSEDKQMGNFFIDSNVDERQFVNKVMFYLWNDVCKDEVGTKNNFFRNYTNAEKDESVEFSFNDLFSTDASHILLRFVEYLDVKADEAAQIGEEPETDGE